jgi:hypothetical protein
MDARRDHLVPVRFAVPAERRAQHAELVAEFLSWTALAMDRADDGSHHVEVLVDAGRSWRYGFVIDGEACDGMDLPPAILAHRNEQGPGFISAA